MKQILVDSCINCPYINFKDKVPDNLEDSFIQPFCTCLGKVLPDDLDYYYEVFVDCPLNNYVMLSNVIVAPTRELSQFEVVKLINSCLVKVSEDVKSKIDEELE